MDQAEPDQLVIRSTEELEREFPGIAQASLDMRLKWGERRQSLRQRIPDGLDDALLADAVGLAEFLLPPRGRWVGEGEPEAEQVILSGRLADLVEELRGEF